MNRNKLAAVVDIIDQAWTYKTTSHTPVGVLKTRI